MQESICSVLHALLRWLLQPLFCKISLAAFPWAPFHGGKNAEHELRLQVLLCMSACMERGRPERGRMGQDVDASANRKREEKDVCWGGWERGAAHAGIEDEQVQGRFLLQLAGQRTHALQVRQIQLFHNY